VQLGGHGHIGSQPQIFEVTREKKVVGEVFDYKQFSTISGVLALDAEGDPAEFESCGSGAKRCVCGTARSQATTIVIGTSNNDTRMARSDRGPHQD